MTYQIKYIEIEYDPYHYHDNKDMLFVKRIVEYMDIYNGSNYKKEFDATKDKDTIS
jgi:hypothetical protein